MTKNITNDDSDDIDTYYDDLADDLAESIEDFSRVSPTMIPDWMN